MKGAGTPGGVRGRSHRGGNRSPHSVEGGVKKISIYIFFGLSGLSCCPVAQEYQGDGEDRPSKGGSVQVCPPVQAPPTCGSEKPEYHLSALILP